MQALLCRALTHTHRSPLGGEVEVRVGKKQKKVLINMWSGRPLEQVDVNT